MYETVFHHDFVKIRVSVISPWHSPALRFASELPTMLFPWHWWRKSSKQYYLTVKVSPR